MANIFTINLAPDQALFIKEFCDCNGLSMNDVVAEIISEWVEKQRAQIAMNTQVICTQERT